MKLSDYVAGFLAQENIKYAFGLTGGAVVHLFDSLAKNKDITPIFNHHEQAAAFAAEAYARICNDLGACIVTTGPGGTNAITGVLAAWMDSIPCVFISGQARMRHTSRGKPVRQIGVQEFDIVTLVSHITKYAVMLDKPENIKYELQKAVYIARKSRSGPVWIDIPLDYQWAEIDPVSMQGFIPKSLKDIKTSEKKLDEQINIFISQLNKSQKPLILAGYGIRLAHAETEFIQLINALKLPFVTSWNASDFIPSDHPLNIGRIGMSALPGGVEATKDCDLFLAIGSHLCLPLTGINSENFAKNAVKVIVDIDPSEICYRLVKTDLAIESDAKIFLNKLLAALKKFTPPKIDVWKNQCREYKKLNDVPTVWKKQQKYVNPYVFIDYLSQLLKPRDNIVVDGGGTALFMSNQKCNLKSGQRLIVSSGISAMGTGLPESVGACFANNMHKTICMIGDGSMQLNIQELQTIFHHKLPIKVFVFNNAGYLAIRHTQNGFLEGRHFGSSAKGGMSLPDFQKIAHAYGIRSIRINNHRELVRKVKFVLKGNDPVVCEIMISPDQQMWLSK